jgi:hypothetical protein
MQDGKNNLLAEVVPKPSSKFIRSTMFEHEISTSDETTRNLWSSRFSSSAQIEIMNERFQSVTESEKPRPRSTKSPNCEYSPLVEIRKLLIVSSTAAGIAAERGSRWSRTGSDIMNCRQWTRCRWRGLLLTE